MRGTALLGLCLTISAAAGRCPIKQGLAFQQLGNKCLAYVSTAKPWLEAQKYCRDRDSDLVTVSNEEENLSVKNLIGGDSWIGLNDLPTSEVLDPFYWSDGSQASYRNFNPGEPGDRRENCIEMFTNGYWNDMLCTEFRPYVCQTEVWPGMSCPEKPGLAFRQFGRRCLAYVSSPKTWMQARAYCRALGCDLASIKNVNEVEEMKSIIKGTTWTGLSDIPLVGDAFRWSAGEKAPYRNWNGAEPGSRKENCVQFFKGAGTWNDLSCTASLTFVCQARAGVCHISPCLNGGSCTHDPGAPRGYKCWCKPGYEGRNCEIGWGISSK